MGICGRHISLILFCSFEFYDFYRAAFAICHSIAAWNGKLLGAFDTSSTMEIEQHHMNMDTVNVVAFSQSVNDRFFLPFPIALPAMWFPIDRRQPAGMFPTFHLQQLTPTKCKWRRRCFYLHIILATPPHAATQLLVDKYFIHSFHSPKKWSFLFRPALNAVSVSETAFFCSPIRRARQTVRMSNQNIN